MDGSHSLTQRLARRIGREALHLLVVVLLLIPALYLFFCVLAFGEDHSIPGFLARFLHDSKGQDVFPQLWRGLGVTSKLIFGSLAISIPISVAVGWWGSVNPRAGGLKVFLTMVSSIPAFAPAYVFYQYSKSLFLAVLSLALCDLMLSIAASHVLKEISLELRRNYVRTAVAKGVSPLKHYWRRLVVEVLCVTKSRIAYLIGGTVVVERIFSLRGLGNMAWEAVKEPVPDVTKVFWVCLISVIFVYLLDLCEALLRDALMPTPLTDDTVPGFRERVAAVWAWLVRLFRPHRLPACAETDPPACPKNPRSPATAALSLRPLKGSVLVLRLKALLSYSAMNRVKFFFGLVLWFVAFLGLLGLILAGPLSATGLLGAVTSTNEDVLGLTLLAGRRLLLPALIGVMIPIVLGVTLGACGGYFPHSLLNKAVALLMNLLDAMPKLVLVMIFAVEVRADDPFYLYKIIPFMGFTFTPIIYDHVRKRVEYLQRMNFVETERALGAGSFRIVFLHILFNNCRSIVSVHGVHLLGQIVLLDAAFDYLGLAQPEHYTWGALFNNSLREAFMGGEANAWAYLAPLLAILLCVLALTTLSDGLDALLEPHMQEAA